MLPLNTKVRVITEEFPHGVGLKGTVVGHYQPYEDCPAHLCFNQVRLDGSKGGFIGFRTHALEVLSD